ncbi:hypothetical protein OH76DRAFT_280101 [Lentinus brumalis]|uniref:Uncharacterized protein n=1 Tax=Lentinus brumalis TaxID=2498619 RepID=A0A371CKX1_9APHY|nr:hypothetical protein OH76DRAFT_280101 [Polyporus brumalis]
MSPPARRLAWSFVRPFVVFLPPLALSMLALRLRGAAGCLVVTCYRYCYRYCFLCHTLRPTHCRTRTRYHAPLPTPPVYHLLTAPAPRRISCHHTPVGRLSVLCNLHARLPRCSLRYAER